MATCSSESFCVDPRILEACRGCQWAGPGINYRTVRSPHGFALDALKSAMQKYIRRAEASKAVFCVREIHAISASQLGVDGARGTRAQAVFTNLIHRLLIIFMEDCGPAGTSWASTIYELISRLIPNCADVRKQRAIRPFHGQSSNMSEKY